MSVVENAEPTKSKEGLEQGRLTHLFSTRAGGAPPLIAGRSHEQGVLAELLGELAQGQPTSLGAVLFGPRGNGKTVLLNAVASDAQSQHGIDVVSFTPTTCPTEERLSTRLLEGFEAPQSLSHTVRGGAGVGVAKGQVSRTRTTNLPSPSVTFATSERIKRTGKPLVIAVDEAHRLQPNVGEALLNAVQEANGQQHAAIALLAGTPDLIDHIGRMNATFFLHRLDDCLLPMGRISDHAALQAVAEPLRNTDLKITPEAEQAIIELCAGYPYFTQVLGRTITESPELSVGCPIPLGDPDDAAHLATRDRFLVRREKHYRRVWSDLRVGKLISCGYMLEKVLQASSDGRMRVDQVEWALETGLTHLYEQTSQPPDLDEAKQSLKRLGLLWDPEDTGASYELGIPSFFGFLTRQVGQLRPALAVRLDAELPGAP